MNLSFGTNMAWQTVQSQIRQPPEEQSDQGLHCLPLQLCILSLSEFLDMLNESCGKLGQVKIVGDKLLLSSSCPSKKLSSLVYF